MIDKKTLRADLRKTRTEFVASIPTSIRALMFNRPPAAVAALVPTDAVIGVYHEMPGEVPASNYARWFNERGHRVALPWFADRTAPMQFREWKNPFADEGLVRDPFKALQPTEESSTVQPDVVFCPLLGFTASGGRIGYGAGHYDRWLTAHPPQLAIGLAWDCQLVEQLPLEPHDRELDLVITQSRVYESRT